MTLYIDTTDFNRVAFALAGDKKIIKLSYSIYPHKSHETLQKLAEFLKRVKSKKLKVTNVVVNKGPGSFTGTRVGITIAQALGFAWNVPVKFLGREKFLTPSA